MCICQLYPTLLELHKQLSLHCVTCKTKYTKCTIKWLVIWKPVFVKQDNQTTNNMWSKQLYRAPTLTVLSYFHNGSKSLLPHLSTAGLLWCCTAWESLSLTISRNSTSAFFSRANELLTVSPDGTETRSEDTPHESKTTPRNSTEQKGGGGEDWAMLAHTTNSYWTGTTKFTITKPVGVVF